MPDAHLGWRDGGAIFALFGLRAFAFSGAAGRFDDRELIMQEANGIGPAHLRVDLPPAASRPAWRS